MLTYDYKKLAKRLTKESKFSKTDLEKIQLAIGDMIKNTIESASITEDYLPNIRIKRFGIFKINKGKAKYYKNKQT